MALLMLSTKKVVTRIRLDIFAGPRVFGTWSLVSWSVVICCLLSAAGFLWFVYCRLLVAVGCLPFVGCGL